MTYVNWALTSNAMGKKETNFKQTDIGLIPHDWEVEKLEDITSFPTSKIRSTDINVCTYISTENMLQNNLGVLPFNGEVLPSNVREYKRGDILVSNIRPYLRKSYLATQSGGCSSDVIVFRPLGKIRSDYLHMCLSSSRYATEVTANSTGTKMPRGCLSFIRQFQVPLPPIEEQKRIAEVLSHFDEHIDNLAALLEKRKQVKAATMHALLSCTTRLPGFTAPWINKYLREITSVTRGEILVSSDYKNGPIPVIGGGTTIAGFHNKANREGKTITISASGANAGYVSFYTMPIFASDCCTLSEGEAYDIEYLYQYLRSVQNDIYRMQTGGAQPHIYPKDIESLWISMPASVTEQSAIASVLSNMDRGIEALEEQIEKYRQMKEGAMEELLTGKVCLI